MKKPVKPEDVKKKPVKTVAHCQMFTNLAGMSCPLCGVAIQPNVGHVCSK